MVWPLVTELKCNGGVDLWNDELPILFVRNERNHAINQPS